MNGPPECHPAARLHRAAGCTIFATQPHRPERGGSRRSLSADALDPPYGVSRLIGFIPPGPLAAPGMQPPAVVPPACLRHNGGRIRAQLGRPQALCQALDKSDQTQLPLIKTSARLPIFGVFA